MAASSRELLSGLGNESSDQPDPMENEDPLFGKNVVSRPIVNQEAIEDMSMIKGDQT